MNENALCELRLNYFNYYFMIIITAQIELEGNRKKSNWLLLYFNRINNQHVRNSPD